VSYRAPEPLGGQHDADDFACGEPALDHWLAGYARDAQASGSARVYVTTLDDAKTVIGYYALAPAQIAPDDATARARKGQPRTRPIPALLLARLAVDERHQNAGVGRSLLQDVLLRCVNASELVGGRVLLVHAKHERAKAWYMQFGFEASPTDPLHLVLLMKDVRATLAKLGLA